MYMIFKLIISFVSVQSLLACPGAKKSNLRPDEVESFHRQLLSNIIGTPKVSAQFKQSPVCGLPTPFTLTEAGIRLVYKGLRTDFYALIDSWMLPPAATKTVNGPLTIEQQQFRVSNLLGNALRLVFHDAGEVDIRTNDLYGSDGCLSASGPNSGLQESVTLAMTVIEDLWQKYCDKISRADFWVLFGKIAAESGLPTGRFAVHTGAPAIIAAGQNPNPVLNIPFQYGRRDNKLCDGGQNRLPAHQPGLSEFTKTFVQQMGVTVHDGVTLSGAHTVGHVHTQFSGFGHGDALVNLEDAPLTNAWDETPWIFDNIYYDSLAIEFWLNNDGATPGTNFWAVQVALGVPQPVPVCADLLTCGAQVGPVEEEIFCINPINGDNINTPLATPDWTVFTPFQNTDPANPCNCVEFFAVPPNPNPINCNVGPHSKTIMLNADMAQNFPITDPASTPGGKGVVGELCAPFVVSPLAVNPESHLVFPQPVITPNPAVTLGGFGCVGNSIGHLYPENVQTIHSTALPKDPNNPAVSLFAQVAKYNSAGTGGTCINGISVFNEASPTYAGYIQVPLAPGGFIGQNDLSTPSITAGTCVEATGLNGVGRDLFYRDFEKAYVKMVTVGYTIDNVQTGPSRKLGNLKSIILGTKGGSSTCPVGPAGSCTPESI